MIEKIEYSKLYSIRLLDFYGGTKYNVLIIGKTDINNVSNNEDEYNIYETFFQPQGLGIASYYTAIQSNTTIYICRVIESLEPLTISDEKVFIPESLIDKNNSSEYFECSNFNFTVYPIIRRFSSEQEKTEFIENIAVTMKRKLKELIEFSVIDNNISVSYDTIYLSDEDITSIESKRVAAWNDYNRRVNENMRLEREKENRYNSLMFDLTNEKKEYEKAKDNYNSWVIAYQNKVNELEEAIKNLENK